MRGEGGERKGERERVKIEVGRDEEKEVERKKRQS
jgi:hypothetical protein